MDSNDCSSLIREHGRHQDYCFFFFFIARYTVCVRDGSGARKKDAEPQVHGKIDRDWQYGAKLIKMDCMRRRGDVHIRLVESGVHHEVGYVRLGRIR